jgi:hypothetical protein
MGKPLSLKQKLERIFLLKEKIEGEVKAVYEEHNKLIIEVLEHLTQKKGATNEIIMRAPLTIAFKGDDVVYTVVPNYMSNGLLKNVIWKPAGAMAFDVKKTARDKK